MGRIRVKVEYNKVSVEIEGQAGLKGTLQRVEILLPSRGLVKTEYKFGCMMTRFRQGTNIIEFQLGLYCGEEALLQGDQWFLLDLDFFKGLFAAETDK